MSTREFTFSEGPSHKFWNITLNGKDHEVQYGRIGTAGQSQTKSFATEAEAKASYDKLIAEKVKKGYAEAGAGAVAPAPAPPKPAAPSKPAATPASAKIDDGASSEATQSDGVQVVAPAVQQEVILEEPRRIDLSTEDLRWATWKPQPPHKVKTAPTPYDPDEAAQKLSRIGKDKHSYNWQWSRANIPIAMSPEEARFWLAAMTGAGTKHGIELYKYSPAELGQELKTQSFAEEYPIEEMTRLLGQSRSYASPELVIPVVNLWGPTALILLLDQSKGIWSLPRHIFDGLRSYVLPYLTDDEQTAMQVAARAAIQSFLNPPTVTPDSWSLRLAAAVGGSADLIRDQLATWPTGMGNTNRYTYDAEGRVDILMGIANSAEIVSELKRLDMTPMDGSEVRAILANTDFGAVDFIRDSILKVEQKDIVEPMLRAFARAYAPEVAPCMLELMLDSRAPRIAREWLEAHPVHAANGLLPVAAGHGKLAEAAVNFLNDMRRRGYTELLRAKLENLSPDTAERLRASIVDVVEIQYEQLDGATTPDWLKDTLAKAAKPTAAEIARAGTLPPILAVPSTGEGLRRLTAEQIGSVLSALRRSTFENIDSLITAIKQNADRRSLDIFSLRLFELWLADGGPSKAKWEMMATGHLGGDAVAMKLAPLVRQWPGESQHPRAVLGLECLRAIGTDTALMQINGIAQKVAFKGIKTKAAESMELIAKDRGMSRAELEDRIVPDCDLDERGTRVFDFGPRKFTFVLGPDMKPMIKDEANQRKPDLPKPNSKDDKEKAEAAVAEWKLLKKQISEVAKIQAVRLEQAMVTGRRWATTDFDTLLVHHPLMTNIVRLIVWGAFDKGGKLIETFRVTEDLSLADSSDDTYELTEDAATVGVVHPLQLTEAQRGAWGEVLSDYEIVPPFEQIGRLTFGIEPSEADTMDLAPRYKGVKIPPQSLVFTLEKLGWTRGAPMDGGVFTEHLKVFHAANITVYVCYEGVPVGYMEGWDDQPIENVFFLKGTAGNSGYYSYHGKDGIKLEDVDRIVMSEVLKDVELVASKGKAS